MRHGFCYIVSFDKDRPGFLAFVDFFVRDKALNTEENTPRNKGGHPGSFAFEES